MSQEDTIWQNEQKEVIWTSVRCQDQAIHTARASLNTLATLVTSYRFRPGGLLSQMSVESSDTSAALDIYYDAQVRES